MTVIEELHRSVRKPMVLRSVHGLAPARLPVQVKKTYHPACFKNIRNGVSNTFDKGWCWFFPSIKAMNCFPSATKMAFIDYRDSSAFFESLKVRTEVEKTDLMINESRIFQGNFSISMVTGLHIDEGAQCIEWFLEVSTC